MNLVKKIIAFSFAKLHVFNSKLPLSRAAKNNNRDNLIGFEKRFNFKTRVFRERKKQAAVFFVDGTEFHGGLVDRFKGIVSIYHYCLCKDIPFKLYYKYPFELKNYLIPNKYDWTISSSEISYHVCEAKYMSLVADSSTTRLEKLNTKKQIHFYGNRDVVEELNTLYHTNYTWGELFKQLFKLKEETQIALNSYKEKIGGQYSCAQLRFQNLLGDFSEIGSTELSEEEKNDLISVCKHAILNLQKSLDNKKLLVAADSGVFLKNLIGISDVYVFPEKIAHIDNDVFDEKSDAYLKPFIDFYLLANGTKIYSIGTSKMYKSEFPLYAAKINNIPFERIEIF